MSILRLKERWKNNFKQPEIQNLECKLCSTTLSIEQYEKLISNDIFHAGEIVRYKCPNCDVIFGDLRFLGLSSQEISNDYIDLYSFYSESDTTKNILSCFKELNLDKSLRGLDYACGKWNNHIEILNDEGYNIMGYDRYVKKESSFYVDSIDGKMFDYIMSNNFIEHVIDPINDLKSILDHINKNGLLILITACFEYCYAHTHYHTFFFLGRSINMLEKLLNITLISTIELKLGGDKVIIKTFKKN